MGTDKIEDFIKKHPEAEEPLLIWKKLIEGNDFKHIVELWQTFPTADFVDGKTVFNVKGNKIRTITIIEYGISQVIITHILTHKDYDRERWK